MRDRTSHWEQLRKQGKTPTRDISDLLRDAPDVPAAARALGVPTGLAKLLAGTLRDEGVSWVELTLPARHRLMDFALLLRAAGSGRVFATRYLTAVSDADQVRELLPWIRDHLRTDGHRTSPEMPLTQVVLPLTERRLIIFSLGGPGPLGSSVTVFRGQDMEAQTLDDWERWPGHTGPWLPWFAGIADAAAAPEGKRIVALLAYRSLFTTEPDRRVLSIANGRSTDLPLPGQAGVLTCVAYPSPKRLFVGDNLGAVYERNQDGSWKRRLVFKGPSVASLLSRNGKVAAVSGRGDVWCLDADSFPVPESGRDVRHACLAAHGVIAIVYQDERVELVKGKDRQEVTWRAALPPQIGANPRVLQVIEWGGVPWLAVCGRQGVGLLDLKSRALRQLGGTKSSDSCRSFLNR